MDSRDGALSIHARDVYAELLRECRHQRVQLGARALEALRVQRSEHVQLRLGRQGLDIGLERVHVVSHDAGDDIGASLGGDALEHALKLCRLVDALARAIHGERRDSLSGDARQRRGELSQLLFAQPQRAALLHDGGRREFHLHVRGGLAGALLYERARIIARAISDAAHSIIGLAGGLSVQV